MTYVVLALMAALVLVLIFKRSSMGSGDPVNRGGSKQHSSAASRSDEEHSSSKHPKTAGEIAAEEFLALAGDEDRANEIPAHWMQLWSVERKEREIDEARSWIGGVPRAPEGFEWPKSGTGKRQHFLAQIDLADLQSATAHGVPATGALLVFFGIDFDVSGAAHSYTCLTLSEGEMAQAVPQAIPEDLQALDEVGFFIPEPVLRKWPVDLVPFLDDGTSPPAALPQTFAEPEYWITTWGLAAPEIGIAVKRLEASLQSLRGEKGAKRLAGLRQQMERSPISSFYARELARAEHTRDHGPNLLERLLAWQNLAESKPGERAVDQVALSAVFKARRAYAEGFKGTEVDLIRDGHPTLVWDAMCLKEGAFRRGQNFAALSEMYRDFAEKQVAAWRGHRVFGIEPPFPNNGEDFRGQDCLISIASDPLLGTETDHNYGMSVWCPRDEMAKGQLQEGQFVLHCAV